jgi:hypothetical protein
MSFRSGLVRYVEKDQRGVIEDSVSVPSDQVKMRSVYLQNTVPGAAISDSTVAIKFGSSPVFTGESFGTLTEGNATSGANGAQNTCFFTFTERGVYHITGFLFFTRDLTWAFGDGAFVQLQDALSVLWAFSPVYLASANTATIGHTIYAEIGDVVRFNIVVATAGNGTMTQDPNGGAGNIQIYKIGDIN